VISVLLVDDDPGFLRFSARILGERGLEVVGTAPDAANALTAADAMKPDIVLVDIGLPDRDGIDLAFELAVLSWKPRVILVSADRDAASAVASDRGGGLPFVPKDDLTDETLRQLLTTEIARR
jgi:DNA-binding NarL/FixJ family response regulator